MNDQRLNKRISCLGAAGRQPLGFPFACLLLPLGENLLPTVGLLNSPPAILLVENQAPHVGLPRPRRGIRSHPSLHFSPQPVLPPPPQPTWNCHNACDSKTSQSLALPPSMWGWRWANAGGKTYRPCWMFLTAHLRHQHRQNTCTDCTEPYRIGPLVVCFLIVCFFTGLIVRRWSRSTTI